MTVSRRTQGQRQHFPKFSTVIGLVVGAVLAGSMLAWPLQRAEAQTVSPPAHAASAAKKPATTAAAVSKPEWHELTAAQQHALQPLAGSWAGISEGRKRKWLAISQNFAHLPASEQTLMHERMKYWASLSQDERSLARLNYAGAKELSADERLAKWQAYQALSDEEKRKLAATAPAKPVTTAIAVRPVAPEKLTTAPALKNVSSNAHAPAKHVPKIVTTPQQVDRNTLLPQPGATAPAGTSTAAASASVAPALAPSPDSAPVAPAATETSTPPQ